MKKILALAISSVLVLSAYFPLLEILSCAVGSENRICWTSCDESETGNGWWFNPDGNESLSFEDRYGEKDAVVNTVIGTAISTAYRNMNGIDISEMEYMEFDLYVSNADLFSGAVGDAQLELTSCDWVDNYEIHYNKASLAAISLTQGWNHIKISLSDFVSGSSTVFDAKDLKFMRLYVIYSNSDTELTVKCDNICFTKDAVVSSDEGVNWSEKNGWWFDPNTLEDLSRDNYKTENDAVIMATGANNLIAAYRTESVDISKMTYVELDLYLSDAAAITSAADGELELTSSNWCDSQEINLNLNDLKAMKLETGWNHLKVALSDFNAFDGKFNDKSLSFMRFYLNFESPAEYSVKISNIAFTNDTLEPGGDDGDKSDESGDITPTDSVDWSRKNGWWFDSNTLSDLERDNYKAENDAVIMATGANNLVAAYRTEPVDISNMAYMELDLFLSDVAAVTSAADGELELTSSNWCDLQEINLSLNDLKAMKLESGWNHLKVALSDFNALDGKFNDKSLNFMRFYLNFESSAEYSVKISNIVFTKAEEIKSDTEEVRDTTAGYITGCDSRVGWLANSGTKISLDTEDKQQGAAALEFSSASNGSVEFRYTFDSMDFSNARYLTFYLYISDASVLNDAAEMQVELSSSGEPDNNELNWNLSFIKGLELENGWNTVKLPMIWGASAGGEIDLSKVCYFRIYCVFAQKEEFVWKIDGLKTENASSAEDEYLSLDCDTVSGWSAGDGVSVTRDTAEKKQGSASVRFHTVSEGIAVSAAFSGADINGANAVQFYIRVPDTSVLETATEIQFELSSSGEPDKNELHWGKDVIVSRVTEDGWNFVTLLFEEAEETGDKIDLTKLNFLRLYIVNKDKTEYIINLDDIRILKIKDIEAVKNANKSATKPVDGVLTLSKCDSLLGWSTGDNAVMTLDKQNKISGKASIAITSENGILYRYDFDSVDASFANYLEFDLYISSLATFNAEDMQVELSSNTDDDDAEINWNKQDFLALDLKQGWNHIKLYFGNSHTSSSLSNDFDASKLCFFRFYISSNEPVSMKLDNLCVSAGDAPSALKEVTAGEIKENSASLKKQTVNNVDTGKVFSVALIIIPVSATVVISAAIAAVFVIRKRKKAQEGQK